MLSIARPEMYLVDLFGDKEGHTCRLSVLLVGSESLAMPQDRRENQINNKPNK